MNLGAHMSIAGGLHLACERGKEVGCDVIQIFVKNQRQWAAPKLEDTEARQFRAAQKADPNFVMAYWGEAMSFSQPL